MHFFRCVNLTSVFRVSSPSVHFRRFICVLIVHICLCFKTFYDFATICCHKIFVIFRFLPFFLNYLLSYHLVSSMTGLIGC